MTDTTTAVTELRWNKDVYPPVGPDDASWVPCTTSDGRPAALALDDQEREALGRRLLHLDDEGDVVDDRFFESERLYVRNGVTFRCEGIAPYPGTTEPRAFGFKHHGHPNAGWASAVLSERAWRRGWEDITCPEHGYECAPHAPVADCPVQR
ncbi:hypothetical protein PV516_19340 [Streptomyces scabiei]|uniref:hypothetical protein n=1 Tax=Streptomyces scabiei TaxID=1930 RepID=UPI0029AEBA93|nr:hypothetical protein [Streptomyces scabiei]MDX3165944.1 hypothetical protein [Streptomyces scabiei]